jgi:hypothetical protein
VHRVLRSLRFNDCSSGSGLAYSEIVISSFPLNSLHGSNYCNTVAVVKVRQ